MRLPSWQNGRPAPALPAASRRVLALAVLAALVPGTSAGVGYGGSGFSSGFGGGSIVDRAIGLGVIGPAADDGAETGQSGWAFTSGVAVSATYSDNANLTADAEGSEEELFLQVLPYFALTGEGARVKARGYFAPAIYTGTIGGSPARIAPFLDLTGSVELVPDAFFVDGYAKASMVNNSALGAGGGLGYDNYLYDSDNVTPAITVQISPHFLRRFGSTADYYARLGLGTTSYSDSSGNNALNADFETGFRSGADFQRLPWRVFYRATRYDYDESTAVDSGSSTYHRLIGSGSYVISPIWRVDASLGFESNDYLSTRSETEGLIWSLGGTWTPNQRIALSLGYAGQYYGDSWYLDYRYSHRRVGWFASYRTELTNVQQEFLQSQTFLLESPNGLPVVDPSTGLPVKVTRVSPTLTNESYVLNSFITGIGWTGNRTTAGLDLTWNERQYQVSERDQTDWGIGARVSRELSPELRATARVAWTNYDYGELGSFESDTEDDVDRWQAGILLTRQLSMRSSVSAGYDYRSNLFTSDSGSGRSGDENRVTLIFNHAF